MAEASPTATKKIVSNVSFCMMLVLRMDIDLRCTESVMSAVEMYCSL